MSQLAHQSREHPPDLLHSSRPAPGSASGGPAGTVLTQSQSHQSTSRPVPVPDYRRPNVLPYTPVSPTNPANLDCDYDGSTQDSPTIGRHNIASTARHHRSSQHAHVPSPITILPIGASASASGSLGSSPTSPLSSTGARFRKPAPSPLHNTTAISPPTSPSPTRSTFSQSSTPTPTSTLYPTSQRPTTLTSEFAPVLHLPRQELRENVDAERSYYNSDSSGTATPEDRRATGSLSLRIPNENRSVSDPVKAPGVPTCAAPQAVPGSSRMETVKGPPRNSSIDSAISAISAGSSGPKNVQDVSPNPTDVAKLVKAAGSPEAVIQYLLKEKNSQAQQNAQLWRLVDKQRAMILGLNKDLERSLKEKEKYRKKLKEVMTSQTTAPASPGLKEVAEEGRGSGSTTPEVAPAAPERQRPALDISASPSVGSDRPSPVDVALAPYPITPPADQSSHGPPSAVHEMLDPSHAMPNASDHALDRFDHEAQGREAEESRKEQESSYDLPLNTPIPPEISLQDQPSAPQSPPPAPPQQPAEAETNPLSAVDGLSGFSAPPMQIPRKPPPAPLHLAEAKASPASTDEADDSDLDSSELLETDEAARTKRGRRRTREEDDQMREILALEEAEARSLSKKSKTSSSGKGTPKEALPELQIPSDSSLPTSTSLNSPKALESPGSLAAVLSGRRSIAASPLRSPGLPASPRPLGVGSGPNSPPPSPRQSGAPAVTLSPRALRQPVPLPPNTPLQTPSPHEALVLKSPQPLNIVKKKVPEPEVSEITAGTPTSSRESLSERTKIYKGFMAEEYPDLLITPNALIAVRVSVASSRMKPSRASLISLTQLEEDPVFTLAVLSRADGGELWRVEKDSVSLAKLDTRLKQCAHFTAKTPDRSLFSGHAPAKLDARRRALDQYLDEVLNTPLDTNSSLELCRYLSTNVLPPNADEMGSATGQDEEGAPKLGPGGRQFKSGYLTKRGKNFGGWKARFFVVEGPVLKYFETPGGAHLGTIKLQGAQIGRQSHPQNDPSSPTGTNDEADNQYRHAFLILEPKKKDPTAMTKHVLCAESDRERDSWVGVLLPWISYKDPAEEESKPSDRQGPSSGQSKGASTKKKQGRSQQQQQQPQPQPQPQPQQPQPVKESEDVLIGVSYDTTKQGETPSTDYAEPPPPVKTMSSQQSPSISAPRDPQLISDSAMWQNKIGSMAPPPGMDEKKAKKRSFFGFGPKQRSSSEGTDMLFNDVGSAYGPPPVYTGPVRRVFGAPLSEAVKYCAPRDVRVPLPAVLYRCIQYLEARGAVTEEGIFRLSGSNVVIKQLKERFDTEGDINLLEDEQYHDIHAVASMLKAYLRELPTSILTRDLHLEFVAVTEMNTQKEKIAILHELVKRLPLANGSLLRYLIAFLIKIINNADRNKMTVRNVGIVFSPTLTIPAPVFALFLQNYETIFGITPEEYELPTPGSMDDRSETRSIDVPARPATSGGMRESPHRNRLAEALADQRRGNTPPPGGAPHPLGGYNQLRSTPTPPPAQRYEPNPFAQQNGNPSLSTRPAYESMMTPPGYDPIQYHLGQQRQSAERPAAYEQPHTVRASRRESSILMGLPPRGLTPQGSMSRLREESHY